MLLFTGVRGIGILRSCAAQPQTSPGGASGCAQGHHEGTRKALLRERGSASCLTCWCAIRLRTTSDGSLCSTTTTGQPESGAAPREDGSCATPSTLTSW